MKASPHYLRHTPLESRACIPSPTRSGCTPCFLRTICPPADYEAAFRVGDKHDICRIRNIAKFDTLFRMGDVFENLFEIRKGHFKTQRVSSGGIEQITGFQMSGDMLGLDAIALGCHQCDAVALEESEVCEVPWLRLEAILNKMPSFLKKFHCLMSHEINREQNVMLMLANMRAEQRMAVFLMDLSSRYGARGGSSDFIALQMMRVDIGIYLGLTMESVSRLLMRLSRAGYIEVSRRKIRIVDIDGLATLASGGDIK